MKINPNYIVKNLLDETIIVPTGNAIENFNGLISTNEVAAFIWQNMEKCETPKDMVDKVFDEFEVDYETAQEDVMGFLSTLKTVGMIDYKE